jgi:hypothetical protein
MIAKFRKKKTQFETNDTGKEKKKSFVFVAKRIQPKKKQRKRKECE